MDATPVLSLTTSSKFKHYVCIKPESSSITGNILKQAPVGYKHTDGPH